MMIQHDHSIKMKKLKNHFMRIFEKFNTFQIRTDVRTFQLNDLVKFSLKSVQKRILIENFLNIYQNTFFDKNFMLITLMYN